MREIRLDSSWEIPTVEVVLGNGRKRTIRASLVFDTGAGLTQLDVGLFERLGYSLLDAVEIMSVKGAVGESVQGYVVRVSKLYVLGKLFTDVPVISLISMVPPLCPSESSVVSTPGDSNRERARGVALRLMESLASR